ncbi:MAG: DUF1289 domain-containing protein, partial [Gammaproteobacteria bacterium]
PSRIVSPCVAVCALNAEEGICIGCLRTKDEITFWSRYTDGQRAAIMDDLARRRAARAAREPERDD